MFWFREKAKKIAFFSKKKYFSQKDFTDEFRGPPNQ
jgi:hypothetical protein